MRLKSVTTSFKKIFLFFLFFGLISLIIEITFFNKDFFYTDGEPSTREPGFDYFWIRHLVIFLIMVLLFVFQRKRIDIKNLKPYAALFLLLLNIVPGVSFLSKYLFLFLSFLLFLYLKADFSTGKYKYFLRHYLYIIIFFIVLFILFYPLLFKEGYTYDPLALFTNWPGYRLSPVSGVRSTMGGASDLFDAFLPQWTYAYQSTREGSFPLWRYDQGLGIPLYGGSFHPERLLSYIIEPCEVLTLRILLKLFLSMVGMYFLLRTMKIEELSSIIGGIAYGLSGFIIGWLHGFQSSTVCHIPFLFFFLLKYLKTREMKFLLYFALWSGLTVYSGFIAIAGYSLYAAGLFLVFFYLLNKQPFFQKIKEILQVALFWFLGIMIVSFHFIPMYYSTFISKEVDLSYRQIGRVIHLSPEYFMNILFPFYHGWRITPEIRPYVSSIVILFFILGIIIAGFKLAKYKGRFIYREKSYLSFLLVFIPFLMAMFGLPPFYELSNKLPILSSSPLHRFQSMTCFILVILGMKGVDFFTRAYPKILEFARRRKYLFIALIEILFFSAAFVAFLSLPSKKEIESHTLYPVFFVICSAILAFQISIMTKRKPVFFLMLLIPIISVETAIQNRRYVPVNKKINFITQINVPLLDFVKNRTEKFDGVLVFDSNYNINGTLGNYGIREKVGRMLYTWDHKALIEDTFSLQSFKTPSALALASAYTDFNSSFIQLLGTKYLIFRYEFDGRNLPPYYRLVYNRLDGKIYRNDLYEKNRGIYFCKPKYFSPEEKKNIISNIKSMDYSEFVYIGENNRMNLNCKDDMKYRVDIMQYRPNKVIYKYRTNSDGILTFPEAFDEDWSVSVNGEETEVLKTNLVFRGVAVRKGKGIIIFKYHVSKTFLIFISVGLISFIALIAIYVFSFRKNKRKKA